GSLGPTTGATPRAVAAGTTVKTPPRLVIARSARLNASSRNPRTSCRRIGRGVTTLTGVCTEGSTVTDRPKVSPSTAWATTEASTFGKLSEMSPPGRTFTGPGGGGRLGGAPVLMVVRTLLSSWAEGAGGPAMVRARPAKMRPSGARPRPGKQRIGWVLIYRRSRPRRWRRLIPAPVA